MERALSSYRRFRFLTLFAILLLTFATAATASARPAAPPPTPAAPSNDHPTTATQVRSLPYSSTQDTTGATTSATDPNCDDDGFTAIDSHSVWHAFDATSEAFVRVRTEGSDYDTVLSVYRVDGSRSGTTLTQVGCDDDDGPGFQSVVDFEAQPGERYLILTAQFGEGSGGTLVLNIEHPTIF
jgi:hypothetical protein